MKLANNMYRIDTTINLKPLTFTYKCAWGHTLHKSQADFVFKIIIAMVYPLIINTGNQEHKSWSASRVCIQVKNDNGDQFLSHRKDQSPLLQWSKNSSCRNIINILIRSLGIPLRYFDPPKIFFDCISMCMTHSISSDLYHP